MATRTKKDADGTPEPRRGRPEGADPGPDSNGEGTGGKGASKIRGGAPRGRTPKKAVVGTPRSDGERAERFGALSALASGLEEVVPGIQILDRDLVFDDGGRADLAAVDTNGNLYLVLLADGDGDAVVLDALDALAFAEKNAVLLTRHLGRKRTVRSTQVLVVCLEPDERLFVRFLPLLTRGVGLYRIRTLKSASGEHSYLVPWGKPEGRASVEGFVQALSTDHAGLVHLLVDRMSRLDAELEPQAVNGSLVWRADGIDLLRLEARDDIIEAALPQDGHPRRLASQEDIEDLTERALQRLVSLWDSRGDSGEKDAEAGEPPAGPMPREGPVLTTEEINAFRE